MIVGTAQARASQERRLRVKTQEHQLKNLVVQGTSMSPWEAEVLVSMVEEVFFSEPLDRPLRPGQTPYTCVAATEPAGKPIDQCQMKSVALTLIHSEDLPGALLPGPQDLRERKIVRLTEEARDQGGLLSQEDLARLLACDVRTVRRAIRGLREHHGIHVPTRGQQKDIGPGVTHRGLALRLWLEGKDPVEVARHINHSLCAVERYIQHFCRVVFLLWKGLNALQIALAIGISSAGVQTYIDLYHKVHRIRRYRQRLEEVEIIAEPHYEAEDEKKQPSPSASGNAERRRA